jgi:uncharacterized membrane protein
LAANTVLPWVGVSRPLDGPGVIVVVDLVCLGLGVCLRTRIKPLLWLRRPRLDTCDRVLLSLGVGLVAMSIVGAVRLNNGRGGGVTLAMLIGCLITLGLAVRWRDRLNPGVLEGVIFLVSLALLFMTSLRGWYTTGHDVQREFRVFELTKLRGHWDMANFRDAYNACLSITILPTVLSRWIPIADPYVFKVVFQVLFAGCPVAVYRLAKRFGSTAVAVLATVYFVSFVTFFQDMPMLNRQEVAFLFLSVALLVMFQAERDTPGPRTDEETERGLLQQREPLHLGRFILMALWRDGRQSHFWFFVFGAGMVLSHYSTTYVTLGGLLIALALQTAVRCAPRPVRRSCGDTARSIRCLPVLFLVVAAALWSGPLTHTGGGLSRTLFGVVASLRGADGDARSSDTSYNLLSATRSTPAERLEEYRRFVQRSTAGGRSAGAYYDLTEVGRYPVVVEEPHLLAPTPVGRSLTKLGIAADAFNRAMRQGSARLLQILIGIGVVASCLAQRRRRDGLRFDLIVLGLANLVVVATQVVLPVLSVDYGLLRAFQQALLVLDVFLVIGTMALVPARFSRWRVPVATFVALLFFASSTGVLTQAVGSYEPQLHLNNAGRYYDIYYLHEEETTAMEWLDRNTTAGQHGDVQSEIQSDRYNSTKLDSVRQLSTLNDIFPSLVRKDAYVFLGYSNVRDGTSTFPFQGDLITYHYPTEFLDNNKDLIYSNGSSRVYR